MNSSAINSQQLRQPALIAAALAFLYANVLAKLVFDWWTDENYSHGLLVPFVIGFIVWTEFDEIKKLKSAGHIRFGGALVLFALAVFLGGTLGAELFIQRISLVVMLAGIIIYFFGARILKSLAVPFLLLLLAIPIPQIIFNKIAFPLQIWASQAAVWGIRLFEVPTVRKGNVFEILPRGATQVLSLEVVEACSGIRSLMTLMTLALVLAYFTRVKRDSGENKKSGFLKNPDFWRTAILMLSAIPIAVLTNAARVSATGVLTYYYGRQATESAWHDVSGWLVYLVALGLLILTNFVLQKALKVRSSESEVRSRELENLQPATSNLQPLYSLLAVLIIGGAFINWFQQRGEAEVYREPLSNIPAKLGEWRQKGDEIRFDPQTESVLRTTDYTMREYFLPGGRIANLYVGYYASQRSGATYHSPQNCLPGAGWVMNQPNLIRIKTASGKSFTANKFVIENGVYKEILIYWYQGRGRAEASEYRDKINTVWDSVLRRRSDGSMVRVMTSVGNSETEATNAAIDLAAQAADRLSDFVPE
ncbi:MAG TPA: EpsI family protein [Pyrinomonadaceae bacterium]|nr:EpsI family protein [Pyrinomonadaceae bacterium]